MGGYRIGGGGAWGVGECAVSDAVVGRLTSLRRVSVLVVGSSRCLVALFGNEGGGGRSSIIGGGNRFEVDGGLCGDGY